MRLEWGAVGALALTSDAVQRGETVYAVVVDVLSFTTAVSVAADAGIDVHPYRWGDASAQQFAADRGAALAVPRSRSTREGGISLSPNSIRELDDGSVSSLVLPSPNGSTVTAVLAAAGATVVAASLRNAAAVAGWLADRIGAGRDTTSDITPDITPGDAPDITPGDTSGDTGEHPAERPASVVLVPAGERWPDGSLRPAVEDLWGAGAVAAGLVERLTDRMGPSLLSPEAELGAVAFGAVVCRIEEALATCASGRELIDQGWPLDVAVAAELDQSRTVPVLTDGAYRAAASHR